MSKTNSNSSKTSQTKFLHQKPSIKEILLITIPIAIFIIITIVGFWFYQSLVGPSVGFRDQSEIRAYVEDYLTNRYGDYQFKATRVEYEFDRSMLFNNHPIGYQVDYQSSVIPHGFVIIQGLIPDDYWVKTDYFVQDYYSSDQGGLIDYFDTMKDLEPKAAVESNFAAEFKSEFEPNAYDVECGVIILSVPENYGRIPTLDELQSNPNLYRFDFFKYSVSDPIEDTDAYSQKLQTYLENKYHRDSGIGFFSGDTEVGVRFR